MKRIRLKVDDMEEHFVEQNLVRYEIVIKNLESKNGTKQVLN